MKREEFAVFVESTVKDFISLAKKKCGKTLQRKYAFRWLGRSHATVFEMSSNMLLSESSWMRVISTLVLISESAAFLKMDYF